MNGMMSRFADEVRAIVKQLWDDSKQSGFCCGIRFDAPDCSEQLPTASSCCGVRM